MITNSGSNSVDSHSIKPPLSNITARDRWAYDLSVKAAALSDCRYKIGAVIIGKGGKVLSISHNIFKSHTSHKDWPSWTVSIHAEASCIMRANCDIRGTTIYVSRLGGNGISCPCPHCMECIRIAGIKTIVYSDGCSLVKIRTP